MKKKQTYTLEVSHHFENGGSFWMMILNPTKVNGGSETNLKKMVVGLPGYIIYIYMCISNITHVFFKDDLDMSFGVTSPWPYGNQSFFIEAYSAMNFGRIGDRPTGDVPLQAGMRRWMCQGLNFPFFPYTPLKSNIATQNDAMFEAGDTFSKAHHFWYRHVIVWMWILGFPGCNRGKV